MSDFDEAVRAALESLLLQQQGEDSPNPADWDSGAAAHVANYLAPRVVAAIKETFQTCAHHRECKHSLHQMGREKFEAYWGIDLKAAAAELWAAYQRETGAPP